MKFFARKEHPAKEWQNRVFWHDRSDQSDGIQIIDLLHDIRLLLSIIVLILFFGGAS